MYVGPDCVVMCNYINTYIHTYIHTYINKRKKSAKFSSGASSRIGIPKYPKIRALLLLTYKLSRGPFVKHTYVPPMGQLD